VNAKQANKSVGRTRFQFAKTLQEVNDFGEFSRSTGADRAARPNRSEPVDNRIEWELAAGRSASIASPGPKPETDD
jgi:hypothetical protein